MLTVQNVKAASVVWEQAAQPTIESARSNAVLEELNSIKSKLAANHLESANSRWSAHSASKGAIKTEYDLGDALMAVFGEVTDATNKKFLFLGWNCRTP